MDKEKQGPRKQDRGREKGNKGEPPEWAGTARNERMSSMQRKRQK